MTDGVSLADIAVVTDKNDNMFGGAGGGGMWIFALLILLLIGGGGFFGVNRGINGEPVTEAGLCNAMNFNNLENAVGRLNDNAQHNYQGLQNGLSTLGYETLRNFNTVQQQVADCCCTTQRAIDSGCVDSTVIVYSINCSLGCATTICNLLLNCVEVSQSFITKST